MKTVVIVGAGPAGLYSAYLLAKAGCIVKVFEKKKEIGLPVQCTGIVTSKINDLIVLDKEVIKNKIDKIKILSKNDSAELSLASPDIVLDRAKFDKFLAKKAESAGAEIFLCHEFIKKEDSLILIKDLKSGKIKKLKADYLIGADGPLSRIYNMLNPYLKRDYYKGIQATVNGNFEKSCFSVHLGNVCPDFFAWVVPESSSIARIGLASGKSQKNLFDEFLKMLSVSKKQIIETQAGLIPIYNPKTVINKKNIYLIGDSAGQIKSTTGGGIVQDIIAANCLAEAITKNKDYAFLCRKNLNKELRIHLKIRKYLNKFNDRDYNLLTELIKNKKIKSILEKFSRDSPSKFMLSLVFAEPKFLLFVKKLF